MWASDPIFIDNSFSLSQFNQSGFFVCFSRKFMDLKVKVCFFGDWFGCWVYGSSRFGCFAGDSDLVLGD